MCVCELIKGSKFKDHKFKGRHHMTTSPPATDQLASRRRNPFLPPHMEDGKLKRAVTVSQGIVVAEEEQSKQEEFVVEVAHTVDPEPHCEEEQKSVTHAGVEVSEVEAEGEESLEVGREESSSLVEPEVDAREASVDSGEERQLCVKDIVAGKTRETLAKAIQDDNSLPWPESWLTNLPRAITGLRACYSE